MSLSDNNVCDKCNTRVPRHRPILRCSNCNLAKHYRCHYLSVTNANDLLAARNHQWTCSSCISEALPVNACSIVRNMHSTATYRFRVKCNCCGGQSYSPTKVTTCPWCDQICHKKCSNLSLGCLNCCESIIPGYLAHSHELFDNF